jgi:hypothetical protein
VELFALVVGKTSLSVQILQTMMAIFNVHGYLEHSNNHDVNFTGEAAYKKTLNQVVQF